MEQDAEVRRLRHGREIRAGNLRTFLLSVQDPYYRYKRHEIQLVRTNKNGGETKLVNLKQVADDLNRVPQQLCISN